MSAGLDLTGQWAGVFSYPHSMPPVSFSASLREEAGFVSGDIEEDSDVGRAASVEGRRQGLAVSWLKAYLHRDVHHDVHYEGDVTADGLEISGRWFVVGSWSGTFLMVRKPQKARAREVSADVGSALS